MVLRYYAGLTRLALAWAGNALTKLYFFAGQDYNTTLYNGIIMSPSAQLVDTEERYEIKVRKNNAYSG